MNEKIRTWRCPECSHFVYPNWCKVKGIKVDTWFDGECDFAEPLTNGDRIRLAARDAIEVAE